MTELRAVAAVDIGATKTLVTRRAPPLREWRNGSAAAISLPTDADPERLVERIADALGRLGGSPPVALGCAAPGPLDPVTGVIDHSPNVGWRGVPLRALLAGRLGIPVWLDDDGRLGALGEAALGAGRGADVVAYLTVSTGVGSGLVIEGRPYRGAHGLAGEVGHLVVDPMGPPCGCGGRGHVEAYAGGRSLAMRARADDAESVFRAASGGDAAAVGLVAEAASALAVALAALAAALDPGVIVIGGSIGLGRRRFVHTAVALARRRVLAETGRALVARSAALGAESVLAGAAVLAAQRADEGGDRA